MSQKQEKHESQSEAETSHDDDNLGPMQRAFATRFVSELRR